MCGRFGSLRVAESSRNSSVGSENSQLYLSFTREFALFRTKLILVRTVACPGGLHSKHSNHYKRVGHKSACYHISTSAREVMCYLAFIYLFIHYLMVC